MIDLEKLISTPSTEMTERLKEARNNVITKQDLLFYIKEDIKNKKYDEAISTIEELGERIAEEERKPERKLPDYRKSKTPAKQWFECALIHCEEALEEFEGVYKKPENQFLYQIIKNCWVELIYGLKKMEEEDENNRV